ncbi:MAG: nuclear transport factor 2 family protein [Pseudomonadota bacterium]
MSIETLKSVAATLVEYCKTQQEDKGLAELYAPDAVSAEAVAMGETPREVAGMEALRGKHAWWEENFEVHGGGVEGPFFHGEDRFAVIFDVDATNKASGERSQMREVAIYTLNADGKIAREEFFYGF